ncbi:hypothetical protein BDV12DRAFT_166639 [Aspergillus spectabilis]
MHCLCSGLTPNRELFNSSLSSSPDQGLYRKQMPLEDGGDRSGLLYTYLGTAFPIMFVFSSDDDSYEVLDLDKRAVLDLGLGVVSGLENITKACGAFGVSAL